MDKLENPVPRVREAMTTLVLSLAPRVHFAEMLRDFFHHDVPTTIIAGRNTGVALAAIERPAVEKLTNTIPIRRGYRFQMQRECHGGFAFLTRSG